MWDTVIKSGDFILFWIFGMVRGARGDLDLVEDLIRSIIDTVFT